jgi:hypothetical protein
MSMLLLGCCNAAITVSFGHGHEKIITWNSQCKWARFIQTRDTC